jgi:hypothetical protein
MSFTAVQTSAALTHQSKIRITHPPTHIIAAGARRFGFPVRLKNAAASMIRNGSALIL